MLDGWTARRQGSSPRGAGFLAMRAGGLGVALLLVSLAGCAGDGPATWRLAGPLDRALTEAEQQEVRDVAGPFVVESTLRACPPDQDPYDCNQHWLRVDDILRRTCERALARLESRPYWRGAPSCDQPPDDGL